MQGRINAAKWSEANAAAGTIRTAVRAYFAQNPTAAGGMGGSSLGTDTVRNVLGFNAQDLTGTYFSPSHYTITSVNSSTGIAVVTVTSTGITGLDGTYALTSDGDWVQQ
jgi:type II secretory pathway pseudopilin PulG